MIKLAIKQKSVIAPVSHECSICGKPMEEVGSEPALFMADSWDGVCLSCGRFLAPQLAEMLDDSQNPK